MVERVMKRVHGRMNGKQYGFVEGRSIEDAWNKDYVNETRGKYALGVFVDYRGVFDNLRWSTILGCLRKAGCMESDMRLWSSYFCERRACMNNGMDSVWLDVQRGRPQGSIAGSFVWNLSMNDLLNEL